jgi:hypothetical protein
VRIRLAFACLIVLGLHVLGLHPANAEVRTIYETLQDRGFSNGIQLRSRQSSSVFFTLPSLSSISNLRLKIDGQIAAPSLYRGSLLVSVNGQPVDSFAVKPGDGIQPLQREIDINRRLIAADGSMNLRFETELLTGSDPCAIDFDPANIISILPTTGISYDINLESIKTLADAVQLLPHNAPIVLPAGKEVSPAIARAALHLAVMMIGNGLDPHIQTVRDDSIVAIRLEGDSPGKGAAFLERKGKQFDVVINADRDVVALTRLWQLAPGTILGAQAAASRTAAPNERARVTFRDFSPLPPALAVRQTGEWTLNFPLLAADGRVAQRAILKIAAAPDWSNERPIVSIYLNGQLITAERLNVGTTDINLRLPRHNLNFTNTLRVVVERANERRFCIPLAGGHAVQIMPDLPASPIGSRPAAWWCFRRARRTRIRSAATSCLRPGSSPHSARMPKTSTSYSAKRRSPTARSPRSCSRHPAPKACRFPFPRAPNVSISSRSRLRLWCDWPRRQTATSCA